MCLDFVLFVINNLIKHDVAVCIFDPVDFQERMAAARLHVVNQEVVQLVFVEKLRFNQLVVLDVPDNLGEWLGILIRLDRQRRPVGWLDFSMGRGANILHEWALSPLGSGTRTPTRTWCRITAEYLAAWRSNRSLCNGAYFRLLDRC